MMIMVAVLLQSLYGLLPPGRYDQVHAYVVKDQAKLLLFIPDSRATCLSSLVKAPDSDWVTCPNPRYVVVVTDDGEHIQIDRASGEIKREFPAEESRQ